MLLIADVDAPITERDDFGDFSVASTPASLAPVATAVSVPAQTPVRGAVLHVFAVLLHCVILSGSSQPPRPSPDLTLMMAIVSRAPQTNPLP